MKIVEVKKKGLDLEWDLTIPAENINKLLNEKYKDISTKAKIPGFRQGKVPLEIIKSRYSNSVVSETLDGLINDSVRQALIEKKISPSVQPNVNVKKYEEGKDLTVKVLIQKMPVLEEIKFEEFKLEKSNLEITEKDIKNTLNDIAKKHERFSPLSKKRKSQNGDLILFDYVGKVQGKKFKNGTGNDETVVLGSNKYIPGYEEQMIGLDINEEKTINVKFPDDYREKNLAGKDATFDIKIKDIQGRVKEIKVDNQLAKEVGEENLESLKKKINEKMLQDFKTLSNLKMRREAVELLLKRTTFELPSKMLADEVGFLKNQSKDKTEKEIKNLSERRVKLGIIISSIAEKNKIVVEDSDLTKAVVNEANKYPGQEKKVIEFYKKNPTMMNNLRGIALEEKVMGYVVNSCKKVDKKCTMDELFKSDFLKDENSLINKKEDDK